MTFRSNRPHFPSSLYNTVSSQHLARSSATAALAAVLPLSLSSLKPTVRSLPAASNNRLREASAIGEALLPLEDLGKEWLSLRTFFLSLETVSDFFLMCARRRFNSAMKEGVATKKYSYVLPLVCSLSKAAVALFHSSNLLCTGNTKQSIRALWKEGGEG